MKAITIWQPWASLMALGFKEIETRSWKAPSSIINNKVAIHAAKKIIPLQDFLNSLEGLDTNQKNNIIQTIIQEYGAYEKMPTGAIVATGILSDVQPAEVLRKKILPLERACGDYSDNRFGWIFKGTFKLEKPMPAKGMQRLWNWDGDIK